MKKIWKMTTAVLAMSLCFAFLSSAHSGRTDQYGGHNDNKNVSGLGSYHYHCKGNPAHLHPNGVCPYSSGGTGGTSVTAGWKQDNTGWWYQNANGTYISGRWALIGNQWYYFNGNGYMATNSWIDNYYVNGDGTMVRNQWVGNYFVGADGAWIPEYGQQSGEWRQDQFGWWYRNGQGTYPVNKWMEIKGEWYYFNGSGYMVANEWVGNYYLGGSGAMAKNQWIGIYYVGADGAWASTR